MASPFGIRFFTSGYERTHREMSSIERKSKSIGTGFTQMGKAGAGAGPMITRGLGIVRGGLSATVGIFKTLFGLTVRVTAVLGGVAAAITGVGIALATKFAKGLMTTRENFYLIETALTGVVKNAAQVRKISEWAMKYAAVFPAMYGDVMDAMKGLAMMPSLKPIFTKASVADMEKIMNIVQGLAALDPQQGVRGALLAMREALSGQWRTLQMRFEIRPQDVAEAAGLTMEELKNMPAKAIEALDAFVRLNAGSDMLRKSAESLGTQWGNLGDQYEMFLNRIGQYGAYRKLVEFLMKVNDIWGKILKSEGAKRLGQDISRIFEAAIAGIESSFDKIDLSGAGMFDSLIKAGADIIDKLKNMFLDTKDIFATVMQIVLVYVQKVMLFTIKEIFWPVGVTIAQTIGDAFMETIRQHPMKTWMISMAAGFATGGVPGALGAGAISAVGIAAAEVTRPEARDDAILGKKKEIAEIERELQAPPKRLAFWAGAERAEKDKERLKNLKNELIELEKIPVQSKVATGLDAKLKELNDSLKNNINVLMEKWGGMLPERKDIPETTPAEEQAKKVVEARVSLRIAELTGAKKMVDTLKGQLAYEERLLEYHRKSDKWAAGRGKKVEQLKKELQEITTSISKDIGKGATEEDVGTRVDERIKKEKELAVLEKEKQAAVGDVTRYTGEEISRKAIAAMEKQKNINIQIISTEEQITKLKKEGGESVSQLVDLENKLLDLGKKKIAIEQRLANAKRQQIGIQQRIQMMEMRRGGIGDIGISALEKSKGIFQTFKDWIGKKGPQRRFGRAELPGMDGMSWREAGKESRGYRTRGIPAFFLKQEEVLRGKLSESAGSPVAQKMILEKLYRINVEQFKMARGTSAKGAQFLEANEAMSQLMSVETKLQDEQIALAKEQAVNIEKMVIELQASNKWLSGIHSKTGAVIPQGQPATESSIGNDKIRGANPQTTPSLTGALA